MKTLLLTLAIFITLCVNAQTPMPQGNVIFKEFDNSNASFTVPEGKSWYIYNIYSDYVAGGTLKYNEYEKKNVLENTEDVRIFIKELNGKLKTDYSKNIYGPQVYRGSNNATTITLPIIFSENTTFSLITLLGNTGQMTLHTGLSYISIIEVTN